MTTVPPPRGSRARVSSRPAAAPAPDSAPNSGAADSRLNWRRIAYHALVSRSLDDVEEATNKNRANVPREHLVLYQFSARGHDVAQAILGSLLTHPRDAASAYYRSRPLLLSLGLSIEDALASPLGRSGGFSDGRDIGVVCNLPNRDCPIVLPMSGDVGSQFTPCAGWAQSIRYHTDVLRDASWKGAIGVVLGGEALGRDERLLVGAHDGDDALAADALLHRGQRARHVGARRDADARRQHRAEPGVVRQPVHSRRRRNRPRGIGDAPRRMRRPRRGGGGPALVRLTVPRL